MIDSDSLPPKLISLVKTVAKSEEEAVGVAVAAVIAVAAVALIGLIFLAVIVGVLMLIF